MGENVNLLLYYERLEDKFVIYTSADNGETWSKNETALSDQQEKDSSDLKALAMIKKQKPSTGKKLSSIPVKSAGKIWPEIWISLLLRKLPVLPPVCRSISVIWI